MDIAHQTPDTPRLFIALNILKQAICHYIPYEISPIQNCDISIVRPIVYCVLFGLTIPCGFSLHVQTAATKAIARPRLKIPWFK